MKQLSELRHEIDSLDQKLIDLLVQRANCITRVIEIKKQAHLPARIEERVEEVIFNVRQHSEERGLDPELAEHLWRAIIEWSILQEETALTAS